VMLQLLYVVVENAYLGLGHTRVRLTHYHLAGSWRQRIVEGNFALSCILAYVKYYQNSLATRADYHWILRWRGG
jgi:hypothetical protein